MPPTPHKPSSPEPELIRRSSLRFPVVGVGASAGGLTALLKLFQHPGPPPGMAFVVVLHLSPEHESRAADILQRVTPLRVVQVNRTMSIEADHIYVIAPGVHLAMDDSQLVVTSPGWPRGRPIAIDFFFQTLALAHRERAVAVVLSGTGSDGTVGLGEVKVEGGMTIAQAPADAEHDGMPKAAIAAGRTDFVLPAAEILPKLIDLWSSARDIELPDAQAHDLAVEEPPPAQVPSAEAALRDVMGMLATRAGNNFQHYKRGTVLRRIERRMQVTRRATLPAYRHYLYSHPQETNQLLQDMLISVTSFFRDAETFDALARELLDSLAAKPAGDARLRAWTVGCATGEEAYTLAMLLNDQAAATGRSFGLQVFATDIDDRALAVARTGLYSEGAVAHVNATRRLQYFDREGDAYRIKKLVREQLLFARHNVLRDPPFSRLDVITCRNLLIYLEREVQAGLLEVFHFALNPGGLLVLGSAESADFLSDHFSVVDKKARIYRANPNRSPRRDLLPLRTMPLAMPTTLVPAPAPASQPLAQLHQRLLDDTRGASVVVDANFQVLHVSQGATKYLRHVEGTPSQNLLDVVLPELQPALRPALLLAARNQQRVAARPVRIGGEQGDIEVHNDRARRAQRPGGAPAGDDRRGRRPPRPRAG